MIIGDDMGICPNCGSWVDDGDICMNCGGSGSYTPEEDEDDESYESDPIIERSKTLSDEAWRLENQGRFEEALVLINQAIENYPYRSNQFNIKAIILQDLRRYEEALEFYDRALSISNDRVILANKARCMLSLLEKRRYSGPLTRDDLDFINEALRILPEGENNYDFLQLKGEILEQLGEPVKARICYYLSNKLFDKVDEAEKQLKLLENPNETYIIITGTNFYQNFRPFHEGVILDLVRESDNEFDRDAIRVEIDGETVGYVANSEDTLIKEVKSASDIRDMKSTKAIFVFVLLETYIIARLI